MSTTRTALRRSHSVPVPVPSSPIYSAPAKVTKPNQLFSFSKPGDDHSCDDVFTVDNSPPDITAGALRISSPDSDFDSHPSIPLTPESRSFASPGDSPSPRDSGKRSTGPLRSTKKVKGYQPYTESPLSAREDRRFAHLIGRRVYEDSCASGISDTDLDIFSRGMRSFSREGVRRMLAYKEAAREHRRARIEASAWELEEMIQLQQVIEYVGDTEQEQWKSRAHEAEIVRRLLFDGREVTENITQLTAIRPKEQFELDALDNQLDDLKLHAIRTGLPIFTDDRVGHEPIQLL